MLISEAFSQFLQKPLGSIIINAYLGRIILRPNVCCQVEEHVEIPDVAFNGGTISEFQGYLLDGPMQKFVEPQTFSFMLDRTS